MGRLLPISSSTSSTSSVQIIDIAVLPTRPEVLQLQQDAVDVLEGRVNISTFSSEYQEKIKAYYRFYGTQYFSKSDLVAKRTSDTLDIV